MAFDFKALTIATGKVLGVGTLCAGVCLGVWLRFSGYLTWASQHKGVITVTGHDQGKRETPFMCSIERTLTKEQREHKKALTQKMEGARIETQELPDGFVFRFRPNGVTFAEVADWVATERACCPFFDLAIEAERENGPLSLRITGREGVKQFIRAEFWTLKVG
jgi:hypothetical protein